MGMPLCIPTLDSAFEVKTVVDSGFVPEDSQELLQFLPAQSLVAQALLFPALHRIRHLFPWLNQS